MHNPKGIECDPIDRRAVLEAIASEKDQWVNDGIVHKGALRLAVRIAALPACPVAHINYVTPEESQARAFEAMAKRDDFTLTDTTLEQFARDLAAAQVDTPPEGWPDASRLVMDSTPAPQPALDVAGLVAEADIYLNSPQFADRDKQVTVSSRLIDRLRTALTTLAAQLAQEKDAHAKELDDIKERESKIRLCLGADDRESTLAIAARRMDGLAQADARAGRAEISVINDRLDVAGVSRIAGKEDGYEFEGMELTTIERDALAARLAEVERERDEWKSYKDRVEVSERERDTDRARLHASDDLAVKNAIERDAYKESVQGAGVVIHRIKAERDAALTRAADAEKALENLKLACSRQDSEIQQILGKALGYPAFKDDQANFPGATEADGVAVGEHVAVTLAMEAAKALAGLGAFTRWILTESEQCVLPLDMGDLHDALVKNGILVKHRVDGPCGESCACAAELDVFPRNCYRVAWWCGGEVNHG